ncbi:MAG: hypothetical protein R3E53_14195 [Myxococcota bacterium]
MVVRATRDSACPSRRDGLRHAGRRLAGRWRRPDATGGGLTAPRDDPQALAAAIGRLLDDVEARTLMAKRGRERVLELYAWPRIAASTAGIYREVVDEVLRGRPTSTITSASVG